jgi:hypothetical protein
MNKKGISQQLGFLLILILSGFYSVKAQIDPLTNNDKTQLIRKIVKIHLPKISSEMPKDTVERPTYVLAENISIDRLPQIKGIKFVLVSRNEIEEMKNKEVQYYGFSKFEMSGKRIYVKFSWTSIKPETIHSQTTTYQCQKFFDKWKVKKVYFSVSTFPLENN